MSISQICIDMDGVLCDFARAAVRVHRPDDYEAVMVAWPAGEYVMERMLGITKRKFWEKIGETGFKFWSELAAYDWHETLLKTCQSIAPTIVLSTPSAAVSSVKGKVCWLQKWYGYNFRDYLIGPQKHFCARPGAVLIDDFDKSCEAFEAHGGRAILFPQRWNSNHGIADPFGYTMQRLSDVGVKAA